MAWYQKLNTKNYVLIFLLILVVFAGTLFLMGRLPICACGYVKLWQNDVMSAENSQHLMDWYTLSHIIHGFGFFALMWWISKKFFHGQLPLGLMFIAAVLLETGCEVLENSPMIINYYRANTVSLGYVGDSIINSLGDVLSMSFGFYLAYKLPVKVTIALLIIMELLAGFVIRDNLTLNILMFIHPFQAVKSWQMAL